MWLEAIFLSVWKKSSWEQRERRLHFLPNVSFSKTIGHSYFARRWLDVALQSFGHPFLRPGSRGFHMTDVDSPKTILKPITKKEKSWTMFLNLEIPKLNFKDWDFILKVFHNLRKESFFWMSLRLVRSRRQYVLILANNVSTEKLVSIN